MGRVRTVQELREGYPNYAAMPGFKNWEQYWRRCKSMRYYPAMARSPKGRICHAEPVTRHGELTTVKSVVNADSLLINAAVENGGSIRVEILDEHGRVVPGFTRDECVPFNADLLEHTVRRKKARLRQLRNQPVRLRFLLDRARLYGFHVE